MRPGNRAVASAYRDRVRLPRATARLAPFVLAISSACINMLAQSAPHAAGLRIKTHFSSPARGDTITYIQNDRKRVEVRRQVPQPLSRGGGPFVFMPAPPIVTITRCDRNESYELNLDAREFTSIPIPKPLSQEELQARSAARTKSMAESTPTVLIETSTNDTGERKQLFGYTARRVITTVKQTPIGDSGTVPQETVTDGWYIDLDTTVPCARGSEALVFGVVVSAPRNPGEPYRLPVPSHKIIGKPETGFAVATKQFHHLIDSAGAALAWQRNLPADEMQVTEIASVPLNPALFEVPQNFRKVDHIQRTRVLTFWERWFVWLKYYWMRMTGGLRFRR